MTRSDTPQRANGREVRDLEANVSSRTKRAARWLGLVAAAIGTVALLGWILDVGWLKSVVPGTVTMKSNTAVGILLLGTALSLTTSPRVVAARLSAGLALAAAAIGAATLAETATHHDFGIDQLLFKEAPGAVGTAIPGRMAPETAICFVLLGLALVVLRRDRYVAAAQVLAALAGIFATFELLAFAQGARGATHEWPFTLMAFNTAAAVLLIAGGTLFARADRGLMVASTGNTAGGRFIRRTVPASAATLIMINAVEKIAANAGLFGENIREAVGITAEIVAVAVFIWVVASILHVREIALHDSQELLRRGNALLESIVEGTSDSVYVKDLQGRYLVINRASAQAVGKSVDEVLGKDDTFLFPPEEARAVMERDRRVMESAETRTYEERVTTASGEVTVYLATKGPVLDAGGKIIGLFGISRDITEMKRVDEELRRSQTELTMVFDNIADVVFLLAIESDDTYRFLNVNRSFLTVTGLSEESVIGKRVQEVIPEPAHPLVLGKYREAIREHKTVEWQEVSEYPAGERTGDVSVTPLFDGEGRCTHLIGTVRDITDRVRADMALQEAEARLRAVLSNAPITILATDSQGVFTLSEGKGLERVGLEPGENVGLSAVDLWGSLPFVEPNGEVITGDDVVDRALAGETVNAVSELRGVYFDNHLGPLRDADGMVVGIVGVAVDITERIAAETELSRILELTPALICVANPDGTFEKVNPEWAKILGYTEEEILALGWMGLIHPDDVEPTQTQVEKQLAGNAAALFSNRYRHKDGSYRVFEWKATPAVDGRLYAAARDVTDRNRAEAERQALSRRFILLMENVQLCAAILDVTGLVTFANGFLLDMVGLPEDEVLGRNWFDTFVPGTRPDVKSVFENSIRSGDIPAHFENEILARDGQRLIAWNNTALHDAEGNVVGVASIGEDITARRKAEQATVELTKTLEARVEERTWQLTEVNRELEAFSSSVSHDLRAPLRSVDGFAKILEEDYAAQLDEKARHYLEVIRSSTKHMGHLIESLLRFSRLGRESLRLRKVDLAAIAGEVVQEDLQQEIQDRSVEVTIGEVPACEADPDMLRVVLSNLLGNAVKFTGKRDHAVVEFGITRKGGTPAYFVRDNGAGFDMRYAGKLFGVFERLHNADDFEGTGVGLAMAQRIIHRHGGRIWAEAEVGRGATFFFTIGDSV